MHSDYDDKIIVDFLEFGFTEKVNKSASKVKHHKRVTEYTLEVKKNLEKENLYGTFQLLVFFCSSVPVVLFDTPGISRCRSQHVSVESSSLLHHSIYL